MIASNVITNYNLFLLRKDAAMKGKYLSTDKDVIFYQRLSKLLAHWFLFLLIVYILAIFAIPKKEFRSRYDRGTDGYLIDTISYENPTWSYEKCEDFLFLSEEEFKEKY